MHNQHWRTDNLFALATNKVIPLTISPLTSCCIDYATATIDWEYIRNKIGSLFISVFNQLDAQYFVSQ